MVLYWNESKERAVIVILWSFRRFFSMGPRGGGCGYFFPLALRATSVGITLSVEL